MACLDPTSAPATFWITNPDNVISGNHAAGSERHGFWFALPEHPTGPSTTSKIWPQRTPLKVFKNNVAHSNGDTGLFVDHGPDPDGDADDATWYLPVRNPENEDSAPVVARFKTFTSFMNRNRGVWLRGENHVVTRSRIADNQGGVTFASDKSYLTRSLVVGESANKGNPEPWEDTGPGGRALPAPWEPEEEITGFEFYDGLVGVSRTHFAEFNKNYQRKAGALGYLSPNAFAIHPRNFAKQRNVPRRQPGFPGAARTGDGRRYLEGVRRSQRIGDRSPRRACRGQQPLPPRRELQEAGRMERLGMWASRLRHALGRYFNLAGPQPDEAPPPGRSHADPSRVLQWRRPARLRRSSRVTGTTSTSARRRNEPSSCCGTAARKRMTLSMKAPAGTKVFRWGDVLQEVGSVGALQDKDDSAWHYDGATNTLTVRIVSKDDWSEVEVVRP